MAIRHLTDEEIQEYLDGTLSQEHSFLVTHLESCDLCQNELRQYKSLYTGLESDFNFNLSPGFSKSVILGLQKELKEKHYVNYWYAFLSIIGIIIGLGTTFYFVDFKPFITVIPNTFKLQDYLIPAIYSFLKNYLTGLNINLTLLGFAGLILLVISILDHFIFSGKRYFL